MVGWGGGLLGLAGFQWGACERRFLVERGLLGRRESAHLVCGVMRFVNEGWRVASDFYRGHTVEQGALYILAHSF